jgi:hypothetical protein
MIKKFIQVSLIINLGVSLFFLLQGKSQSILNIQVAFISSLLIVLGSYLGYKKNIERRVEDYPVDFDNNNPDEIDKVEDPYDLYSKININEEELSKEEAKEIFKEEKEKLKNQSNVKNTIKSFGAASSIYRIGGYVLLVIGFFYLNNNKLLEPIIYLIGFTIVPLSTLMTKLVIKN